MRKRCYATMRKRFIWAIKNVRFMRGSRDISDVKVIRVKRTIRF